MLANVISRPNTCSIFFRGGTIALVGYQEGHQSLDESVPKVVCTHIQGFFLGKLPRGGGGGGKIEVLGFQGGRSTSVRSTSVRSTHCLGACPPRIFFEF